MHSRHFLKFSGVLKCLIVTTPLLHTQVLPDRCESISKLQMEDGQYFQHQFVLCMNPLLRSYTPIWHWFHNNLHYVGGSICAGDNRNVASSMESLDAQTACWSALSYRKGTEKVCWNRNLSSGS